MKLLLPLLLSSLAWGLSNSVTITDTTGSTQTNRPITISRVFAEGEITGYAQPRVGGFPVATWQCDRKTQWPDGTVRHAVISLSASIIANSSITVDFVSSANPSSAGNQTATDAAALTQAQMLAFNSSGWGAAMEMTNGSTISADARTMLAAGTWRYWLRGPAVTQVIVEDRTTALAHDIGFDAFKVLHPIFVLTFYPGWGGVKVENILENVWVTKREDQTYSLALKVNNPLSAAWYTKSSFTMYAGTRWRKTKWSGSTPGAVTTDFNIAYMKYTKAVPNYDPAMVPGPNTITAVVNLFNTYPHDITDPGLYSKDFRATGGRKELGLTTEWEAQFLQSMNPQLYDIMLAYGEISGWIPSHARESDPARTAYFGKPVASNGRPLYPDAGPDGPTYVGSVASTGWTVDQAHQSAFGYVPYLITGDWYWLEELQYWAGWNSTANPTGTHSWGRHNDWGFLTATQQARGNAWGLRNYAHTAVMTPDNDPQKSYYIGLVETYAAVHEGKQNITNGYFYGTPQWTWGHDVVSTDSGSTGEGRLPDPLGFMLYNSGTGCPAPELTSSCIHGSPMYMENYLRSSMGHVIELGFTKLTPIYTAAMKEMLNVALDPSINHYILGGYNTGRTKNPGGAWFQTWSDWYTSMSTSQKTAGSWAAISPASSDADCDNGYSHIARTALAMGVTHNISDGSYTAANAYNWLVNVSNFSTACSASNPKWAIIPRTAAGPIQCGNTAAKTTNSFGNNGYTLIEPSCTTGSNALGYDVQSFVLDVDSGSGNVKCGIYTNTANPNKSLICSTASTAVTPGENTITLTGCGTLAANTTYWLGCNNDTGSLYYSEISRSTGTDHYKVSAWPALPNPYGTPDGTQAMTTRWWINLTDGTGARAPATISSNGTGGGAFHDTATWVGGLVPIDGDTAIVTASDVVTVSDSRSVAAVTLGNAGRMVVAAGGSLAVTGDISTGSGIGNTTNALTVNGTLDVGGKIAPAGDFGMRSIVVQGTAGNPAILKSTAGTGRITLDGHSVGNPIQADYALLSGLTGIELQYWNNAVSWNVIRSKFNNVGLINVVGQLTPTDVFIHRQNEHVGSRDVSIFRLFAANDLNGGTRDFSRNVFDKSLFGDANAPYNAGSSTIGGFSFYGNYFGDSQWGYGEKWALFKRNFVRIDPAHPQELFHARGDVSDVAILLDGPRGNPHVISPPDVGITVDGIIFGHSDNNANDTDSGEFLLPAAPATPQTYNVRNSIFLPNAEGYSSMELASVAGDYAGGNRANYWNFRPAFENNTWYGGFKTSGLAFPALQVSESDNMQTGQVQAFRNNILWKPTTSSGLFLKLLDIGNITTSAFDGLGPIADICPAAVCDYNAGFGHQLTASYANTSTYTNQGRGYAAKFTVAPGSHDVDEDPAFLDWQRSIELFEGDYYRVAKSINQPTAWSGSATYSAGDFVRHAVTGYYWSKPINYRYTNGAGCNGANPQPGAFFNANSWRSCWEFATLYRIREGIKSGESFTDLVIGVYGDDIVATLNRWVRAGYAPTNPAFENAGHLGYNDIGAVRVAYPAYSQPTSGGGGSGQVSRRRGGSSKGGSFK